MLSSGGLKTFRERASSAWPQGPHPGEDVGSRANTGNADQAATVYRRGFGTARQSARGGTIEPTAFLRQAHVAAELESFRGSPRGSSIIAYLSASRGGAHLGP